MASRQGGHTGSVLPFRVFQLFLTFMIVRRMSSVSWPGDTSRGLGGSEPRVLVMLPVDDDGQIKTPSVSVERDRVWAIKQ